MGSVEQSPSLLRTPRATVAFVRQHGVRFRANDIVLLVVNRDDGMPFVRVGVSSRKMKGAVQRNRIRRRLRNAITLAGAFPAGCDCFVIGAASIGEQSFETVVQDLAELVAKARKRFPFFESRIGNGAI